MFAESGITNPTSGAIRRKLNDYERNNYNTILQSANEFWIPATIATILDKKRSSTLRSEYNRFDNEQFADTQYNDENDGFVFGSAQLYCDTKQYCWV